MHQDLLAVADLFSPASLILLNEEDADTIFYVVSAISFMLEHWEAHGCVLDPVQREVVLDSLVASHIAAFHGLSDVIAGREARPEDEGGPCGSGLHGEEGVSADPAPRCDHTSRRQLLVLLLQTARRTPRTRGGKRS